MQTHVERQGEEQSVVIPLTDLGRQTKWRQVFDRCSPDEAGTISIHELQEMIRANEYNTRDIPKYVTEKIMRIRDRDNSRRLEFAEFVKMIEHPGFKHRFDRLVQRYIRTVIPPRTRQAVVTDGPYEDEFALWPPPVYMVVVSIIEIVLWIVDAAIQHPEATGPAATALIYNPFKRHEAWRFLTYMFVHVGWSHLTANLLVQVVLGIPLEMVHRWRVLVVYGAGVVAGSLGHSIFNSHSFLAGASGGVYALLAAHLASVVLNWDEMDYRYLHLLVIGSFVGCDIGQVVYSRYFVEIEENISYVGHLAGALVGLLVGIGVLRNLKVRPWEKKLWWVAITVYVLLMVTAVILNIFWSTHFPATQYNYK